MIAFLRTTAPYLLIAAFFAAVSAALYTFTQIPPTLLTTLVLFLTAITISLWRIASRRFWGPLAVSEFPLSSDSNLNNQFSQNGQTDVKELESRVKELKMLGQFSEALNFTVNFDAILWLVYENCRGVLDNYDFYIYLNDINTHQLYTAFCINDEQRNKKKEGITAVVDDRRVLQVIEIGLVHQHKDDDGRHWIIAPLNAGANSVGAIHANHKQLNTPFTTEQEDILLLLATRTATAINNWQTNVQLQTRAQQLESLNEVIRSINSETELQPLLNLILEKAIELLKVEAGSFMLRDENTGELEFAVVHGPSKDELVGTRIPAGKGIAGQVAQTAEPVLINNIEQAAQWFSKVDEDTEFHTRSMLTVPLLRQRTVLGVLQVVNRLNGAPFVEMDKMLLTAFAGEAAVSLENARLLQQTDEALQERVRELTLLQNLDRDLNRTLDLDDSLALTLSWMKRLFAASAVGIAVFDKEGQLLKVKHDGYRYSFNPARYTSLTDHPGLVGHVARTGRPLITSDVTESADYITGSRTTRSQMTIPIVHEGRTIGAATVESDQQGAYSKEDLHAAERLIDHIAVSITNSLLYEEVHAANLAKSEFVSVVSHELKTPLTAIRGYNDLMLAGLTGTLTEQQREYMSTIVSNVNRMMDLIKDLTDISRIDTGQLHVKIEPMAFASVVSETISSIQSLADSKHIQIHLEMPTDLPLIMGDHSRLVQILTNLISNACKYSPENTAVLVTITRDTNEDGEPVIWCSVKDSGYGISQEDQEKLFTKFFRSGDPNVRLSSGTGLGLFITKGLIELHGGELTFESELGKGTTFSFSMIEAQNKELEFSP